MLFRSVRLKSRDWAGALEDLDAAWKLGTRRPEGLVAEAIAQAAARRYRQAHEAYLRALDLDPYSRGADFAAFVGELQDRLQEDSRDPFAVVVWGDGLYSAGKYDKAVVEYTKALQLVGSVPDVYAARAMALAAEDSLDSAQEDLLQAVELAPGRAELRVRLAVVLTEGGNDRAALAQLAKVLAKDPADAQARLRAGNARYFLRDYDGALREYQAAVDAAPLDPNAHNGVGLALLALKRGEDAVESFSRAAALGPWGDRFLKNRGSAWTSLGRYANAAADFAAAARVSADPARAEECRRLAEEARAREAGKSS